MLHVKEAEGNSHAVILMKNGNQIHSQHMDKGKRSNQLLEAQSLQIKHAFIMSIQHSTNDLFPIGNYAKLSNNFTQIITECYK